MPNGVEFPEFPTEFTKKEQERLEALKEQRKRLEEIYQAKFTPEAWAKTPVPERAVRRLLPEWASKYIVRPLTPWEQGGWDYGFTPEEMQKQRFELEEEYKELARQEKVTRLLPDIQTDLLIAAISGVPITELSELLSDFPELRTDFTEEEQAYLATLAQNLLHASVEDILSGKLFAYDPSRLPITPEDIEALSKDLRIDPRFIQATVSFSRGLAEVTTALQQAYPPQGEELGDEAIRQKFLDYFKQRNIDLGITVEEGEPIQTTIKKAHEVIAKEEGELLTLKDEETGQLVVARKKAGNTVWFGEELLGYYDEKSQRVVPYNISTGEPFLTEEAQEFWLKDLWDGFYLGLHQAWHGTKQALFSIVPQTLLQQYPERVEETEFTKALRKWGDEAVNTLQINYDLREAEYQEWLVKHPELLPRPEYTQNPIEHTELFKDPLWYPYVIVSNAPIIGAALIVGITTAVATKNPWAGAVAGAAIITPVQMTSVYEDLIASGASPDNAASLATGVGILMGAVEILPGMIVLKATSPVFMRLFRQNLQKEMTKQIVTRLSAKGVLATAGKIEIAETCEEMIQQAMQNAAVRTVDENRSIVEDLPQVAINTLIAVAPLAMFGGGAEYLNMKSHLPKDMQKEMDVTTEEMEEAGLAHDHALAVAFSKLTETDTGQAAVEVAAEKAMGEIPEVPEVMPEVELIADLREGAEYEGRFFFGSYSYARLRFAEKDAPIRKMMPMAREHYNALRKKVGLEPVTDWTKRPAETLEQRLRRITEPRPPVAEAVSAKVQQLESLLGTINSDIDAFTTSIPAQEERLAKMKYALEFPSEQLAQVGRIEDMKESLVDLEKRRDKLVRQIQKLKKAAAKSPVSEDTLLLDEISNYETRIPTELIRKDEKEYLRNLTEEVKREGIREPITIRVREDGSRIVWDGIHRLIVAQDLGIKTVPVKFIGVKPPIAEPEAMPEQMVVPDPDAGRELSPDRRPRLKDWVDDQEDTDVAVKANKNISNRIVLDKTVTEARDRARTSWEEADEDGKKAQAKEAGLKKNTIAKSWDDMSPPEQSALALVTIPDKSIIFPIKKETFDIRYYLQFLEEKTGLPFYTLFKRIELSHGAARVAQEHFLRRIGADPNFTHIRTDEEALARVAQEINARNPRLKIEHPEVLSDQELLLANVVEELYKYYEPKVRYLRFMRIAPNMESLKEALPDAPEEELALALELRKMGNLDDLYSLLEGFEWGVIGSGYDPWLVSMPTLVPSRVSLGTTRGAARLMRRDSAEFPAGMEKNVLLRLATYLKQIEAQWRLEPELDVLEGFWSQAGDKITNAGQVESALREWTRELQGIPTRQSFFDSIVRRVWRQAMSAVFLHPWMAFRNFHQALAFHPDRTELFRLLAQKPSIRMQEMGRIYFDTFVSQLKGIRRDWLYMGERGLPGLGWLTRLSDRMSLYSHSDNIPRWWSFEASMQKAMRATEQYQIDKDAGKWLKDSGAVHLRHTERNYALQLLAQPTFDLAVPGLKDVSGSEMASLYVGHEVANMTHFIYERAFRAPVELGATGRTIFNLIVFPRGYFQRVFFQAQKVFDKDTTWEEAKPGLKDIILIMTVGIMISEWLKKVTGRPRRAYNVADIVQWQLGGLVLGVGMELTRFLGDVITALDPTVDPEFKKDVLARLPGELIRQADVLVPFYRNFMDSIEAITDTKNIDVHFLRQMRAMFDKDYTPEELEELDRKLWEKLRKAVLAGEPPDPTKFQEIQTLLIENEARLGEMDAAGRFYTLRQFAGDIRTLTKPVPDDMLTETYNFSDLVIFNKECEDRWEELYKIKASPASLRKQWRMEHEEVEAMLLFWGMYSASVYTRGSPEWNRVAELLRVWFDLYNIDKRMHQEWADWSLPIR